MSCSSSKLIHLLKPHNVYTHCKHPCCFEKSRDFLAGRARAEVQCFQLTFNAINKFRLGVA